MAYTEALTLINEDHDPEAIFEELHKHFTKTEIANLTIAITQINTWNRVAISFGTTPGTYQVAEKKAVKPEDALGFSIIKLCIPIYSSKLSNRPAKKAGLLFLVGS